MMQDHADIEALKREIDEFRRHYQSRHLRNFRLNAATLMIGAGSAIVSIGAFATHRPDIAAIAGVAVAGIGILQRLFPMEAKAEFSRVIFTDAEILLSHLSMPSLSTVDAAMIFRQFEILRRHAAESLPRGQGIEAVRRLTVEQAWGALEAPEDGSRGDSRV